MQPVSQDRLVGSGPSEFASLAEPPMRPKAPAIQYDAFISYSHAADDRLAPALRSGLQRFATPWRLFRLTNPVRSLRVFQDTASLSANPELWPTIERALMASDWFVLLASPDAADSPWVGKEVNFWCRHKSPKRLLIVQTDGEITWNGAINDFDWTKTDAIPETLSGAFREEPRWVDARFARTEKQVTLRDPRFRDLIAELAAPLRGIPKDDLIGEDIRQHRRLNFWRNTGVAFLTALLIVATSAAVIAVQQRNEAERNFRHAIDSADTLVTQVAQRLRPLTGIHGVSADTVREVLVKAEEIFKKLTDQVPESRELRDRKAAMLMTFAEISGALNDTEEQIRRAKEAYDIMQGLVDEPHKMQWLHGIMQCLGLVEEEPDNNNLLHGLAMSQLTLGDALEAQGHRAAALSAYRTDQAIMERLVAQDPSNVQWKRDLAISQTKVGFVLSTQGDLAGALAAFRDFQTDMKTLLEQSALDPKLQRNLSSSHFLVSYAANESPEQLLKALRAYQATMKRLVENDPSNTVWKDDLASIHTMIALFLKNQGDLTGADKEQNAALEVMKLLTSNDPKNVNWQAGVANSYEGISSILQLKGDVHGALDTGATAMIVWQNLAKQDSDNPHWRYRLAMSHAQIAGAKRLLNDPIGAISEYNAAEQLLNTLTVEVDPNYLQWKYQLSLIKHSSGVVLLEHSDLDGARAKFLEANKMLEDLAARDPSNTKTHSLLAQSLSSMTMVAEDRISALQYARKSQEIAQHLTLLDPDNTEFQYLLSESHDAIGGILRADGNLIDSLSSYRDAQKILDAMTHTNAVQSLWKMRLLSVYCNIGGILQAQNDFDGASVAYFTAKDIIDGITDHVDIDSVQFPLKRVHLGLGGIKWAQGDWAGALEEYKQSNAVTEQQARRYPSRDDLQLELALNQKILSYLLTKNGDQVDALDASRSAFRILEDLVQRDPDNVQTWDLLRDTIGALVDMSHALTRYREAVMYSEKWVAMCRERKAKKGKNGSDLATALGNLSRRYIFNRQFEDAEAAAREGYDLDQQKKWILINRANAEMFLGHQDAAMEMHTQHINDVMPENGNKKWREVAVDNFADFKAAGLEHPNIINIEKFLADKN